MCALQYLERYCNETTKQDKWKELLQKSSNGQKSCSKENQKAQFHHIPFTNTM